jgi:hypothetical protein
MVNKINLMIGQFICVTQHKLTVSPGQLITSLMYTTKPNKCYSHCVEYDISWYFPENCVTINPLMLELNPSAQCCLTRFFTGDFPSWTMHFINICMKNQQIHQLFIQFIKYAWWRGAHGHHVTRHNTHIHNILSTDPQLHISQKALGTLPEDDNVMPKHVWATIHN